MTAWIGVFCVALAFCSSLLTAASAARTALTGQGRDVVRWSAATSTVAAAGAVVTLEWALLTHDFSVRFVADNGSLGTPVYYTVTSLWAAHDGSLMLWSLVLGAYLVVVALRPWPRPELHSWAVALIAAVAAFFLGLQLLTSHVFDRVFPVPPDGPGPTPLLRDHPAMGVHPPLLYVGLVGLVVPFAFAVAALVTGLAGRTWLDAAAAYLRLAWTALTAGILLGAWWSYAVLGWGGYWAWDPVENSSLMPWLLATALLHSAMVQRRTGALPAWNLFLATGGFLLACVGVLLTRSGLVASVHSFADSGVGPVLLGFLAALGVGVVAVALIRPGSAGRPRSPGALLSKGVALLGNNVLLVALAATVLLGTVLPLLAESWTREQISVGPPYYNRMAVPFFVLLLGLLGVGPLLRWRTDRVARVSAALAVPLLAAAGTVLVVSLRSPGHPLAALVFGLSALVVVGALAATVTEVRTAVRARGPSSGLRQWARGRRAVLAARVAHVGVAVMAVGVAASSAYTTATRVTLGAGDQASVSGATVTLEKVTRSRGTDLMQTSAVLTLGEDGAAGRPVEPALRFYPARQATVAVPAVVSRPWRDVYLTLLTVTQSGDQVTVRLAVNPMVAWVWGGGALVVLGGAGALLAAAGRRRRRPGGGSTTGRAAATPEPEPVR